MKKNTGTKKPTHKVNYSMPGGTTWSAKAYSKTDLLEMVRDLLKQGYTRIAIDALA